MADETNAAPSEAPANEPARAKTMRDYARELDLADWQLAQFCAVTKRGPDEEADDEMIAAAAEFLTEMKLGG